MQDPISVLKVEIDNIFKRPNQVRVMIIDDQLGFGENDDKNIKAGKEG